MNQFFPHANQGVTTTKLLTVRMREHCKRGNAIIMETEEAQQHRIPVLAGVPLLTAGPQWDMSF